MGFFPTTPNDGDEIGPNTHGTYFKYSDANDAWYIISKIEISNIDYDEGTWDANTDGATKNVIRDELEAHYANPTDMKHLTDTQLTALHAKQHAMDDVTQHTRGDNAVLDSSTDFHGFLKKLDNDPLKFMNGQGNWAVPAGEGGGSDKGQLQGHIVPLVGCVWGSSGINMYEVNDSAICVFDITANMDAGEDIVLGWIRAQTWNNICAIKMYIGFQKTNSTEIHSWNYINGTEYPLPTPGVDWSLILKTWTIPAAVFDVNDTMTIYFYNSNGQDFRAHSMYLRYTEAT